LPSGSQGWVAEAAPLLQGFPLQLADPLGGDAVLQADVGELVLPAVDQAVARPDDVGGAVVELTDQAVEPLARLDVEHGQVGSRRGLLSHQVTQRRVAVLVDRRVQADVLAAPGHQVEDPLERHAELVGDLLRVGVAAELPLQGAASTADLVELLDHVHGEPDDACLLRDAAGDRLPHPPGGVRRELVALRVVELLDRTDQAGVALLDQVQHGHLGPAVLAGDRDDQPQVGVDEGLDSLATLLGEPLELVLGGRHRRATLLAADAALGEQVLSHQAGLDRLRELDLGLGVEQRVAGDLIEVEADAVAALDLARSGRSGTCSHVTPSFNRGRRHCVSTRSQQRPR
jgi:hypothetical protein